VRPWGQWINDPGFIIIGADKQKLTDANGEVPGPVDLSRALTVSSDVYFYGIGNDFWNIWNANDKNRGNGIQTTAREFGFGAKTGVELDESQGRVPDEQWKQSFAKLLYKNDKAKLLENSQWFPGDNVNLAVGQGDLVATPLQLADAYAAFANGGDLLHPHVAQTVTTAQGAIVERFGRKTVRHIAFDPGTYSAMMNGFLGAVNNPKGTAYDAFKGFPSLIPVAGKTGTAQVNGKGDTSLFAGFFPANNPKYVVAAVIEQAGFGSEVAAPVVRRVMEQLAGLQPGPLQINNTKTAD
jgi:penicillin-binding protein 2